MKHLDPERIEIVSISDVGRQRSNNQDSYGEGHAPSGARWMMVADGMGGHAGGETASRVAVETVSSVVGGSDEQPDVALRTALEEANRVVHDRASSDARLAGMGTTGVAMLFCGDGSGWVANVGDSRAYRLRGEHFEQISFDHSLVAELQRRGVLSEEEALVHPRRNEVLRSLGVEAEVTVDLHELDLQPGDLYLLCSDGLSGVMRDPEIAEIVAGQAPAQAVRTLVDRVNERGGPDNVTVQIARVPEPDAETLPTGGDRRRRIRVLSLALAVVAALLAIVLLVGLVGELRRTPAVGVSEGALGAGEAAGEGAPSPGAPFEE